MKKVIAGGIFSGSKIGISSEIDRETSRIARQFDDEFNDVAKDKFVIDGLQTVVEGSNHKKALEISNDDAVAVQVQRVPSSIFRITDRVKDILPKILYDHLHNYISTSGSINTAISRCISTHLPDYLDPNAFPEVIEYFCAKEEDAAAKVLTSEEGAKETPSVRYIDDELMRGCLWSEPVQETSSARAIKESNTCVDDNVVNTDDEDKAVHIDDDLMSLNIRY